MSRVMIKYVFRIGGLPQFHVNTYLIFGIRVRSNFWRIRVVGAGGRGGGRLRLFSFDSSVCVLARYYGMHIPDDQVLHTHTRARCAETTA